MSQYTIKQVAELLKVTPQAIYKRINDTENNNELIKFIETDEKGVKHFNNDGLTYLKQIFMKTADIEPVSNVNNELIEALRAENKTLKAENESLKAENRTLEANNKDLKGQIGMHNLHVSLIESDNRKLNQLLESIREDYKHQLAIKDEQIERSQRHNENAQSIIYAMQQTQSKRRLLDFFKKPVDDERG